MTNNNIEHIHMRDISSLSALKICSPKISQLHIRGTKTDLLNDSFIGKRVGIVGTRNATQAGLTDARRIAQVVSQAGGVVVSGMALGVDGAAHRGALDCNGATIAVLGSGLDVIYPARHTNMSREIMNNGCLVSEYDCNASALAWHFPIRNRIIAALSDVLVVPEGTLKGGARITVDLALAMGKTICALPGPRRNFASELPNALIKDGAVCISDPSDVLCELGWQSDEVGWELTTEKQKPFNLSVQHRFMLEELAQQPRSSNDLAHVTDTEITVTRELLAFLEKAGKVRYKRGLYEVI